MVMCPEKIHIYISYKLIYIYGLYLQYNNYRQSNIPDLGGPNSSLYVILLQYDLVLTLFWLRK